MAKKDKKAAHVSETPATQMLRAHGVAFTSHPYEYLERGAAQHSAAVLGLDPYAVVKTLVMQDQDAKPLLVLMHGNRKVSTKNLARQIGAKSVESAVFGGYVKTVQAKHPDAPLPAVYLADGLIENARGLREKMGDEAFFSMLGTGGADAEWGAFAAGWDVVRFDAAAMGAPGSIRTTGSATLTPPTCWSTSQPRTPTLIGAPATSRRCGNACSPRCRRGRSRPTCPFPTTPRTPPGERGGCTREPPKEPSMPPITVLERAARMTCPIRGGPSSVRRPWST